MSNKKKLNDLIIPKTKIPILYEKSLLKEALEEMSNLEYAFVLIKKVNYWA